MSNVYSDKAEENRRKYPEIAKLVDEVRKYFPGARVVSIKPTTKSSDENRTDNP